MKKDEMFLALLAVLFIGLKLTGHIAWSWWWVTLPIWGGPAIVLAGLLGVFVCSLVTLTVVKLFEK